MIAASDCQHINLGDKACNFRLTDQNGDTWDLRDIGHTRQDMRDDVKKHVIKCQKIKNFIS